MSFLKKLFGLGGGAAEAGAAKPAREIEHNGFTIAATPYQADGQYQTCGVISRDVEGVRREHRFVRADRFATRDDAIDVSLRKGQQLVDEQGERLFG